MNEGYSKVFVALDGTEQQDFVLARAIKVAANNGAKLIIGTSLTPRRSSLRAPIRPTWSAGSRRRSAPPLRHRLKKPARTPTSPRWRS